MLGRAEGGAVDEAGLTAEAAKAEETAVEATGEELRVAEVRAAVVREAEAMEEGSYSTASRLVTATKRAIVHMTNHLISKGGGA